MLVISVCIFNNLKIPINRTSFGHPKSWKLRLPRHYSLHPFNRISKGSKVWVLLCNLGNQNVFDIQQMSITDYLLLSFLRTPSILLATTKIFLMIHSGGISKIYLSLLTFNTLTLFFHNLDEISGTNPVRASAFLKLHHIIPLSYSIYHFPHFRSGLSKGISKNEYIQFIILSFKFC